MSLAPKLNPEVKDYLLSRGYNFELPYEVDRIPDYALPRTKTCTQPPMQTI